jgi:elongation factor G
MAKASSTTTIDLTRIRNLGIIAHIDAGKTTTSEHLLFYAGVKHKLGGVDTGNTETDYDQEEQERGITIYSACIPFPWRDHTVNLIDTPGHVDFTAEVERSLRVLDGCVCVFDAQKGVEAQSETVWRQANKYSVPRMVFINKMDVVGANFEKALQEVRDRLEGNPLPLVIPIGYGSDKDSSEPFCGVIDLLQQKALYFERSDFGKTIRVEAIPEVMLETVAKYREQMFDALTQHDEKDLITTALLEGQEIPIETIQKLIREQTIALKIQPVLSGSGREHIGIQPLLDAIVAYLPCPLERPAVSGENPKKPGKEERRKPDPKEPFSALVFKVIAQDSGDLFFIRIYSGTMKANSRALNPGKDVKENIAKLYHIHADPTVRDELPEAYAGDIVATIGLKDSVTGDTLCDTQQPILLEKISFADAVIRQRIEPESSADKDKLTLTLQKLMREDPTFICQIDKESGQMIMSGMGTLHLEVKRHKMERDYRLKIRVGKPQVTYRETLKNPVTLMGECDRQFGQTHLFAKIQVQFDNKRTDPPVKVINKLKPNDVPAPFQQAIERGLKSALSSGGLGYPVLNVQATILDAIVDAEKSTETAFEAAAADAVMKAFSPENMSLLEPMMKLSVNSPEEFLGNVISYIMARRGEILRQDSNGKTALIESKVPLVEMFNYADDLRSLSQGRAGSSMEPQAYEAAPDEILRAMIGTD